MGSKIPAGGPVTPEFAGSHDALVALSAVAATDNGLVVGTDICQLAQRGPIVLAKQLAGIRLCGGRVVFNVGDGRTRTKVHHHGELSRPTTRSPGSGYSRYGG